MKLWTGQTISQFGDEITLLGIPLLAIGILGAGPLEMGILGVVRFLPWIFFTLPAGVWVDRMRRRPILIGADIARAALLASIPIAFVGGFLTLIQVYIVAFIAGTLEVFFDVAYQSYLPSIVERDELVEGNSKLELSRAGSQVAGPTVAGFLIQAIGAPFAIAFDALSYLGAALFIGLIRRRGGRSRAARSGRGEAAEHVAGGASRRRLRRLQSVPAQHRRHHRHRQPVQQHQRRGADPLPRRRGCAQPGRRSRSASSSPSATSG